MVTIMTKTLSKVCLALLLSSGIVTAQAANLGTLTSDASFADVLAKNQNDILSKVFNFTIDSGYTATVKLDNIGSSLIFEQANLNTKVSGGWTSASDSTLNDGLFGAIGPGKYKLQFMFDSAKGGADTRLFSGLISVSAVPEPESYAMFLAGLGIIGAIARRRTQR